MPKRSNQFLFDVLSLHTIKVVLILFTVQQLQRGLDFRTINPSSRPDIIVLAYPCSSSHHSEYHRVSWKLELPDLFRPSHRVSLQVCYLDLLWRVQEAVRQSGQFLSNQVQDKLPTAPRNILESSCCFQRFHQFAWHREAMPQSHGELEWWYG